jgi:general secretion pathway protein H
LTLLELMVVIAIMGLATAGVSLAMRDTAGEQLSREAERLAALLEAGRAASRASGSRQKMAFALKACRRKVCPSAG